MYVYDYVNQQLELECLFKRSNWYRRL